MSLPVVFDGERIELGYRIDLVVEGLVIVEVKCVDAIHPFHQIPIAFLHGLSGIGGGLLINFLWRISAMASNAWSMAKIGRSRASVFPSVSRGKDFRGAPWILRYLGHARC